MISCTSSQCCFSHRVRSLIPYQLFPLVMVTLTVWATLAPDPASCQSYHPAFPGPYHHQYHHHHHHPQPPPVHHPHHPHHPHLMSSSSSSASSGPMPMPQPHHHMMSHHHAPPPSPPPPPPPPPPSTFHLAASASGPSPSASSSPITFPSTLGSVSGHTTGLPPVVKHSGTCTFQRSQSACTFSLLCYLAGGLPVEGCEGDVGLTCCILYSTGGGGGGREREREGPMLPHHPNSIQGSFKASPSSSSYGGSYHHHQHHPMQPNPSSPSVSHTSMPPSSPPPPPPPVSTQVAPHSSSGGWSSSPTPYENHNQNQRSMPSSSYHFNQFIPGSTSPSGSSGSSGSSSSSSPPSSSAGSNGYSPYSFGVQYKHQHPRLLTPHYPHLPPPPGSSGLMHHPMSQGSSSSPHPQTAPSQTMSMSSPQPYAGQYGPSGSPSLPVPISSSSASSLVQPNLLSIPQTSSSYLSSSSSDGSGTSTPSSISFTDYSPSSSSPSLPATMSTPTYMKHSTQSYDALGDNTVRRAIQGSVNPLTSNDISERNQHGRNFEGEDVCGRPTAKPRSRIIGGQDAFFGEFPWQVHIKIAKHQCGGALVNRDFVVTAAHCVYQAPLHQLSIIIGAHDIEDHRYQDEAPQYFSVAEVRLHPSFRFSASHPDRFDVAVLRLDKSARYSDNVLPVCLPPKGVTFQGWYGVVTGWGKTDPALSNRYGTRLLQKVDVPIIQNDECESWHQTRGIDLKIFPEMFCAGYEDGRKDACVGDSGGPLVVFLNNRWTLAGITSAGFGCAQSRQPGIYHRLPVTVDWVMANITP